MSNIKVFEDKKIRTQWNADNKNLLEIKSDEDK